MRTFIFLLALLSCNVSSGEDYDFFESKIRPLLSKHCYGCHSETNIEGRLRLDIKAGLLRGGNGGPAIVPGFPEKSLLIKAVRHTDSNLQMPPADFGEKLTSTQIKLLEQWIRTGAADPREGEFETEIEQNAKQHWAFLPIVKPEVPKDRHPVDYLLEINQQGRGLETLPTADARTLIRRLSYDLTGLPPTPEELDTPLQDYSKLIDNYLASEHYGERWARHWLDVARYSDAKDGVLMYGDARIRPFAYTYRDYVIRAFNQDIPFDQFIAEQLAADQLDLPENSPALSAMGFLTLGRLFDNNIHDVIDDQIDVVSRGFLGLTVSCARCHDHKFDPIPTADYYSLYGVFANSEEPYERPRVGEITEEGTAFEDAYNKKLQEIADRQSKLYAETLYAARSRTTEHLVRVATTEPDNTETTIFFLSLTKDQLRPQITYAWRQYIAQQARTGHRIFGPWADLMQGGELTPDLWKEQGIEPRVISALAKDKPQSPEDIAKVYGELLTNSWGLRSVIRNKIKSLESRSAELGKGIINLADLMAGGDGLGKGESNKAINPVTGETTTGSTSSIDAGKFDTYLPAENPYVDGVFIPQQKSSQIISSTGLAIHDAPIGNKTVSWDYIKYGPSQGFTSSSINGIEYAAEPNWMMGLHANKGFTIDIAAIRALHDFEQGEFKTVIGHGGAKDMSTIDVAIYLDGERRYFQPAFKAQQSGPELSIPLSENSRFLTILITEGTDGNSHDQGFFGNPRIEIGKDAQYQAKIHAQRDAIRREIETLEQQYSSTPDPKEDELAQVLLDNSSPVWFPKRRLYFYLGRTDKDAYRGLLNSLDSIAVSNANAADRAMVMVDKSDLNDPAIFQRGDPTQLGNTVPRQFLKVLSQDRKPFERGAGRLDLAHAIADRDNPLTPRVWANRIWLHHFGTPLVENPSDFGLRNEPPLQLQMLDYLAAYLIANEYQTKALHRLILTSQAYQRTSFIPDTTKFLQQNEIDPSNQYYWRFNRRRLDLEQMRDSLLLASGLLDRTMYGRPVELDREDNNRRTIYAFVERQNLPNMVQVFDAANADSSTALRPTTTVPQQALFALNSPFIERVASNLATRIEANEPSHSIGLAYKYTLGRAPTENEISLGLEFLATNELVDFAQALLISNEFWFVD